MPHASLHKHAGHHHVKEDGGLATARQVVNLIGIGATDEQVSTVSDGSRGQRKCDGPALFRRAILKVSGSRDGHGSLGKRFFGQPWRDSRRPENVTNEIDEKKSITVRISRESAGDEWRAASRLNSVWSHVKTLHVKCLLFFGDMRVKGVVMAAHAIIVIMGHGVGAGIRKRDLSVARSGNGANRSQGLRSRSRDETSLLETEVAVG